MLKTWNAKDARRKASIWTRQRDGTEEQRDERGDVMAVRVPLTMMDGLDDMQKAIARDGAHEAEASLIRHSPGPLARSAEADARIAQAHAEYEDALTNAWQTIQPNAAAAPQARTPDGRQAAYSQYESALTNAWRGGKAA